MKNKVIGVSIALLVSVCLAVICADADDPGLIESTGIISNDFVVQLLTFEGDISL